MAGKRFGLGYYVLETIIYHSRAEISCFHRSLPVIFLMNMFCSLHIIALAVLLLLATSQEARMAIEQIVIPREESVELLPRPPHILSLQMDLIRKYHLQSERIGMETEENVRLRILPLIANVDENVKTLGKVDPTTEFDDFIGSAGDTNGSHYSVDRLPLLPE